MKKTFENQWQEAFKDVDIPAPESSWPWIETELDKKKRRPFLFLWTSATTFKFAAACLVVVGLGLYMLNQKKEVSQLAQTKTTEKNSVTSETKPSETTAEQNVMLPTETPLLPSNSQKSEGLKINNFPKKAELAFSYSKEKNATKPTFIDNSNNSDLHTSGNPVNERNLVNRQVNETKSVDNISQKIDLEIPAETARIKATEPGIASEAVLVSLEPKPFEPIRVKAIQKRDYLEVDFPIEKVTDAYVVKNKMWLGLQSGVSPFNPSYSSQAIAANYFSEVDNSVAYSVRTLSAPTSDPSASKNSNPNLPYDEFSNGISRNVGFEIGKKLRKNWTLSAVLRLSNAKINQRTNVFSVDKNSGNINTFYQSSYLNNSSNNDQLFTAIPSDNIQRFRYLQIPIYVAYQYPINAKLDIEFQTGISNDVFLGSKISGDIIETSNFTSRNSRFKFLNFSGLGGLGLNLKVSKNWRAIVQGNFQKALFSGTKTELEFRPKFLGINYGLRYVM